MPRITLRDRLRYRFDNAMSRGPTAMIAGLALISLLLIGGISLGVWLTGIAPRGEDGAPPRLHELLWMSLLRTLDPGTMGGDKGSWAFLFAMLAVTFGGIFVVSALIGVLTSGIEERLGELRKGRSLVVEKNHTVILGWSPQIYAILREIIHANANQRSSCIAVLAAEDKVEMEDEIRARVPDPGRTRIVCRTGNPGDPSDLQVVNPEEARAIVILSSEEEDADLRVIKIILALTNSRGRRREPYHIVAQLRHAQNLAVAHMIGRDEVQLLLAGELIARMAVQTCRQSGLSVVYTELLDFDGAEIYFQEEPRLVGKTFGEALFLYEDSAVIGLRRQGGRIELNPASAAVIEAGDKVIAISEDDDTVRLSSRKSYDIDLGAIRAERVSQPMPERMLILGWNRWAGTILRELDFYMAPGSEVTVVTHLPEAEAEVLGYTAEMRRQKLSFRAGHTTDRRTLDALDVPAHAHVMVLSYSDHLEPQEADAQTLVTLLHLRDIAERSGRKFGITSQMLDVRNRDLAEVAHVDDFIVSETLVSLMVSQIAENRELGRVLGDLFTTEGSKLYLRPAMDYVAPYRPINFYTVVESARRRGEVAIGYRLRSKSEDARKLYGVKVNPKKSETVAFGPEDRVIVLAGRAEDAAAAEDAEGAAAAATAPDGA